MHCVRRLREITVKEKHCSECAMTCFGAVYGCAVADPLMRDGDYINSCFSVRNRRGMFGAQ